MSRRLLLVEDDRGLGETLHERLEKEGYDVTWCESVRAARDAFRGRFDLILLDVTLPDGSGFDFARETRAAGSSVPFLFITAMNSAEHRLEGYEIGAEEYIPKPFHLKELLLRVRHVLETHPPENAGPVKLADGRVLDLEAQAVVRVSGEREFFAARDFQLLKLLIDRAPKAVSRDEILNIVWGEDKFPSHRTVDNAIVRLRQALNDSSSELIRSVRGVGYQWVHENGDPK